MIVMLFGLWSVHRFMNHTPSLIQRRAVYPQPWQYQAPFPSKVGLPDNSPQGCTSTTVPVIPAGLTPAPPFATRETVFGKLHEKWKGKEHSILNDQAQSAQYICHQSVGKSGSSETRFAPPPPEEGLSSQSRRD